MQSTKLRETLGRFEIVRLPGEGAQGAVYLAYDTRLGRQVAIKTLRMRGGQDTWSEQLQTLLEEARIVSQLSHPNIVTLYDAGEDQGRPYLVFEYVSGELLRKSCGNGKPIKPATAADICIQILKAIDYAHRHGSNLDRHDDHSSGSAGDQARRVWRSCSQIHLGGRDSGNRRFPGREIRAK